METNKKVKCSQLRAEITKITGGHRTSFKPNAIKPLLLTLCWCLILNCLTDFCPLQKSWFQLLRPACLNPEAVNIRGQEVGITSITSKAFKTTTT